MNDDIRRQLDRIERQQREILQLLKQITGKEEVPAAPIKRRMIKGEPHIWAGEGTGWVKDYGGKEPR